jgi:hypothetical protein
MSRTRPRTMSRRNTIRKKPSYAHAVLSESAQILANAGHSPKQLVEEFREICSTIPEPSRVFDPRCVPYVGGLPHILTHWFTDPAYVDTVGKPIALRLRSRGPCLAALIRHVLPNHQSDYVADSLLKTGAVRRRAGLYTPTDRYIPFVNHSPISQMHGLASLARLLGTLQHNAASQGENAGLLERSVKNPHIPISALPSIRRRIKRDVDALLWKLNGYLRRREVEPGSEPTTSVGVSAYAFEDPQGDDAQGVAKSPAGAHSTHATLRGKPQRTISQGNRPTPTRHSRRKDTRQQVVHTQRRSHLE